MRFFVVFLLFPLSAFSKCIDVGLGGVLEIVSKADDHNYVANIGFLMSGPPKMVALQTTSTIFQSEGRVLQHFWIDDKGVFQGKPDVLKFKVNGFDKEMVIVRETAACVDEGKKLEAKQNKMTPEQKDAEFRKGMLKMFPPDPNIVHGKGDPEGPTREETRKIIADSKARAKIWYAKTKEEQLAECKKFHTDPGSIDDCVGKGGPE